MTDQRFGFPIEIDPSLPFDTAVLRNYKTGVIIAHIKGMGGLELRVPPAQATQLSAENALQSSQQALGGALQVKGECPEPGGKLPEDPQ